MAKFKVTFEVEIPSLEQDKLFSWHCYRIVNDILDRMYFHYNYTETTQEEDKFMDNIRITFESAEDINGYRIEPRQIRRS